LQARSLLRRERPAVGPRCEVGDRRELPRNRGLLQFEEGGGMLLKPRLSVDEKLLERLLRVLRRVLHELRQELALGHRLAADVRQLAPQPIKFAGLLGGGEESHQRLVLPMEQLHADDCVPRHDLREAEIEREQLAKLGIARDHRLVRGVVGRREHRTAPERGRVGRLRGGPHPQEPR